MKWFIAQLPLALAACNTVPTTFDSVPSGGACSIYIWHILSLCAKHVSYNSNLTKHRSSATSPGSIGQPWDIRYRICTGLPKTFATCKRWSSISRRLLSSPRLSSHHLLVILHQSKHITHKHQKLTCAQCCMVIFQEDGR